MKPEIDQTPTPIALDYAQHSLRPRHSFYSCDSLAMAFVTVVWLYYVQFERPRHHMGGPFWSALWSNSEWPGGIGLILAVVGFIQNSRKRILSIVAIIAIVVAYVLLMPPVQFA